MQLRSNRVLEEPTVDVQDDGNEIVELSEPSLLLDIDYVGIVDDDNELDDSEFDDSELDDSELDDAYERNTKKVNRKRKKCSRKEKMRNEESIAEVENTIEPGAETFEGISGFEFVDVNKMKRQMIQKKNGDMRPTFMYDIWEAEHRKWIDSYMTADVDLDQQNEVIDEMHEEPSELVGQLLRFQKEWLTWALKQEESVTRGGILANEMGMGRTVQAIALVLAKRELRRAISGADKLLSPGSFSAPPELTCTLIICPASALNQWKREIERFTVEGSTKVLCYQGSKRAKNALQFSDYDFIITTYNTIEADYRKVLPPKQSCKWCGKLFHERRMAVHLKYYCGPHARRTEKQSKQEKKGKKLHWKVLKISTEDDNKKSGKVYNPSKESGSKSDEEDLDNFEANVRKSALHSVKWERIVLDEVPVYEGAAFFCCCCSFSCWCSSS